MDIQIFHMIEGSKQATGLTVIIDVFRAFSTECYLSAMGASQIRPVGTIEDAWRLHDLLPGSILLGERNGIPCAGFDYGNSPSALVPERVKGNPAIHTTSAGTQGIANAVNAEEIIVASLVNVSAVAKYIRSRNPQIVSIVAMGFNGTRPAAEDELCAEMIVHLLKGTKIDNLPQRLDHLKYEGGERFFDPMQKDIYPEEDFWLCSDIDRFSFVLCVRQDKLGPYIQRVDI